MSMKTRILASSQTRSYKLSSTGASDESFCLFEQSGTFKNAFKEFGFEAYDCDILDDFKQTDFQLDLFAEIEKSHAGENSIFDKISKDDLVFCFFPCIKFTEKCFLNTKCKCSSMKNYTNAQKLAYSRQSVNEIAKFYEALCKLCKIATHKGFKLIIENPNSQPHFLNLFFPFEPSICVQDRAKMGDYFKKLQIFGFLILNHKIILSC